MSYDPLPALIDFASSLRYEDIPQDVVHETQRRIIDAAGCAAGALNDERLVARRAYLLEKTVSYKDPGRVVGASELLSTADAAFLNSTMARWLDFNDTYLAKEPAHPSDNLGLLWALSGAAGASGKDLITAAVIAYDVQCRLCEAASLRDHGFDHVNYILISATLGGCRLLGLSKQQMYDAVAFALNSHVALRQNREGEQLSEQKNMAAGDAARAAAWSIEKVLAGSSGPHDIILGKHGFVKQVSGPLDEAAFEGLGEHFYIADTYIKNSMVEYHAQTIVEHALALRAQVGEREPKTITIRGYEAQERIIGDASKRRPTTKETADHSLYFCFAVPFLEGRIGFEHYTPAYFNRADVLGLIDRMSFEEVPEWTQRYFAPASERQFKSAARVELVDGTSYEDVREFPHGHPKSGMSDAELEAKVTSLAGPFMADVGGAIGALWELPSVADVTSLWPALMMAPRG